MIQEIQTNNFELYRLKDISPIGITRSDNPSSGRFWECNGYYFIQDVKVLGSPEHGRIRRFNKDWSNETNISILDISNMVFIKSCYCNGYYYFIGSTNTLQCMLYKLNESLDTIIAVVNISDYLGGYVLAEFFKYKNYYFGIESGAHTSGTGARIFMFNSNANGSFKLDLVKTFSNTDGMDFPTTAYNYNNVYSIINLERSELIVPLSSLSLETVINRYNLDNMINLSGDYLINSYNSASGIVPYSLGYNYMNFNGHYFIPVRHTTLPKLIGYWIYNHEFELVSKIQNLNIDSHMLFSDKSNGFYILDDVSRNKTLPVIFKKLK